jgi:putative transposase
MYEYRKLTSEERAALVKERLARGHPPHSPPHLYRNQKLYLLTATCYEHACYIRSVDRRQQIVDLLFKEFIANDCDLRAWVVLPNHYHVLVQVSKFNVLSRIFRAIHGPTARYWNQEDKTPGRKVWYRFVDRAIRSDKHYYTTINYLHFNPVKHTWAKSPYDWEASSVHWYRENYGRE